MQSNFNFQVSTQPQSQYLLHELGQFLHGWSSYSLKMSVISLAVDLLSGCEQGSLDLTTKSPTAVLTSKFIKGLNSHINTSSQDYLRAQSFTSFIDDRSRSRHKT